MFTHPWRARLSRRQSEQLLDGRGRPSAALDDLSGLLSAARQATVTGTELPGERAAATAFRAARSATGPAARSTLPHATGPEENPSVRTVSVRRSVAVKIAAVGALTTMTIGGVAFAASSGSLPDLRGAHRSGAATGSPSARPTGPATDRPTGAPSGTGSPDDGDRSTRAPASGRPTDAVRPGLDPRAKLLLDCRHWGTAPEQAPAFCAALVEELCPDTLPGARGASPTAIPGWLPGCPRIEPTKQPGGKPSTDGSSPSPSTRPSTSPTHPAPSGSGAAPTGKPSSTKTNPAGGRP